MRFGPLGPTPSRDSRYTFRNCGRFIQHSCSNWWHRLHNPAKLYSSLLVLSWSMWCNSIWSGDNSISQSLHRPSCLRHTSIRNHCLYFWSWHPVSLCPPDPVPTFRPAFSRRVIECLRAIHAARNSAQGVQNLAAFPVGWNTSEQALQTLGLRTAPGFIAIILSLPQLRLGSGLPGLGVPRIHMVLLAPSM